MSGAKDRRPGLDRLLLDARRARVNVVVCWASYRARTQYETPAGGARGPSVAERAGRLRSKEGLDLGSASGRLQLAILAALSQFERERLKRRAIAGLAARSDARETARTPPSEPVPVTKLESVRGISVREGARRLGVARSSLQRWRALARQNPSVEA